MPHIKISRWTRRELLPQQVKFKTWSRGKRCIANYMEMRLGKTLATIRWVTDHDLPARDDAYASEVSGEPCLVMAPTTVLEAWEKELVLERELYTVVQGATRETRLAAVREAFSSPERRWVLMNYETLCATSEVALLPWHVVILDESTAIKNPDAKISLLCCGGTYRRVKDRRVVEKTDYPGFPNVWGKAVLSGLPTPETELDVFQQMKFLYGVFCGCRMYLGFRSAYFELVDGKWTPRAGVGRLIKEKIHSTAFVLRRSDVHSGSARKIKETRYVSMKRDQEEMYRKVEDEFSTVVEREGWEELWETQYSVVQRTWMSRIAGGCDPAAQPLWRGKVDELMSLLKGDLSQQPVVVWFKFNEEIRMVEDALRKAGIPFVTLTGEVPRERRVRHLDWFRTSRVDGRALLCQIKLAKFGVDASVSDTAIYYSASYSCEEMAQSEERILHPLKKTPLLLMYLASKNTVDEDIIYASRNKITNARAFITQFRQSFLRRRSS